MKKYFFPIALLVLSCKKSSDIAPKTYKAQYKSVCTGCNVMGGGVASILHFRTDYGKEDSIITSDLSNTNYEINDSLEIGFSYISFSKILLTDQTLPREAKLLSVSKISK